MVIRGYTLPTENSGGRETSDLQGLNISRTALRPSRHQPFNFAIQLSLGNRLQSENLLTIYEGGSGCHINADTNPTLPMPEDALISRDPPKCTATAEGSKHLPEVPCPVWEAPIFIYFWVGRPRTHICRTKGRKSLCVLDRRIQVLVQMEWHAVASLYFIPSFKRSCGRMIGMKSVSLDRGSITRESREIG